MLQELGAQVQIVACDVSNPTVVEDCLNGMRQDGKLRALFILPVPDDATLTKMTSKTCEGLKPKISGAWNLHRASAEDSLDFFVLFSSIAGVMGSPGQSNYAAANGFMDALAQFRIEKGLKATSIAWGPWAEGGMASDLAAADQARMQRRGFSPLEVAPGLELFDEALDTTDALMVAVNLDVRRIQNLIERSASPVPPLYRSLIRISTSSKTSSNAATVRRELLSLSEADRHQRLPIFQRSCARPLVQAT